MTPPRDREDPEEGTVLSPEELDIACEERVAEIEEGRFVIGPDGPPNAEESSSRSGDVDSDESRARTLEDLERDANRESSVLAGDLTDDASTGARVKRWITEDLERTDSQYAYRIAAKTGDAISHQQLASDDIGTAFDGLLMWYAQQVADGTPVEEALGILLSESRIRVRYPISGMLAYLEANDLEPDDSIADLLDAIRETDGLAFPLRNRR
ncbi:DUF7500 family protein [Halanaeroarchaeum sulfurireducens]|uniref:Uncharacterized protein n=1 Tax=Halanaeroarchaeum sulfurireducens TaxID=1604004 RepID=A0A0N7FTQ9_9EURY|nr:hypothetical protein [Halanaeroarchaeum sulfurireducens]ALG82247.1 hypothetical protein HLASA_1354 [Halanaeroarchaeum sulfurireducens]